MQRVPAHSASAADLIPSTAVPSTAENGEEAPNRMEKEAFPCVLSEG